MDDVLRDYVECKSVTIMGRMRYAVLDKNKLQGLKAKFSRFTETFQHMLVLLNTEAHDLQLRNDGISHAKLDAIILEQKKEAEDRLVDAQENKETRQKIEKVLKILEKQPVAQASSVTIQDPNQVLEQLETELKKVGYSSEKAKAARNRATQELSGQSRSSWIGKPPTSSTARPQNTDECRKPPTSTTVRPQNTDECKKPPTSSTVKPQNSDECRILCVDGSHGGEESTDILTCVGPTDIPTVRSVLAQTYLEIMRVFTAIRSPYPGRWLFKRVDSAGIEIGTVRGMAAIQKGIHKLVSPYEQSPAAFSEVSRVGALMKSYGSFAFTQSDFGTYHYIISFEPYLDLIKKMREDFQTHHPNLALGQIVMLEGCQNISTTECMQDERNIDKLIESIKEAVKRFVRQPPFNCSPSLYTNEMNYRILHFVSKQVCLKYLTPGGADEPLQGGQKLKEIENKTKCSVKVTKRLPVHDAEVLVSIIGPQERLNEAVSLIVGYPILGTGNWLGNWLGN